jgi:mannose PTS system EIIA component
MIGKLILTHGGMARELLAAAQVISGPLAAFEALSLDWGESCEDARARVQSALDRLDQGEGVLILTDIFGSTPSNVAMRFHQPGRIEVLAGVNLPMVLRLACQVGRDQASVAELARWAKAKAQAGLCLASDMVQAKKCDA